MEAARVYTGDNGTGEAQRKHGGSSGMGQRQCLEWQGEVGRWWLSWAFVKDGCAMV